MIKIIQRLEFKDVFPEEKPGEILLYLKQVSLDSLLRTIGFCNTTPLPNYDTFFSNPLLKRGIIERINNYRFINGIKEVPEIVNGQAALKFAELVLANKAVLLNKKSPNTVDGDELNLFKAFLLINEQLNKRQVIDNLSADNYEKIVDFCIIFGFPTADLPIFEDSNSEFLKLVYTTIVKVEHLLGFLNSKPEYKNLKEEYIQSFGVSTEEEFLKHMKYFFGHLLALKVYNGYLLKVDDQEAIRFLESMVAENIEADDDFTHIKNDPLYKVAVGQYSIINFFFAVDKFYRSAKFKLKDIYDRDEELIKKYGNFFGFFNKHFSENYLMKVVLDEIFENDQFYKKPINDTELPGEADYYSRKNNDVYIFENKDVLVAKSIKASADIDQINGLLRNKFLYDEKDKKRVGIGQLVNTIIEIESKAYRFDDYVNKNSGLTVYPVLLVHDRIFQILGINYRLNKWFREEVKTRVNDDSLLKIESLTVVDIDTLILWLSYLKNGENFKSVLNQHLGSMDNRVQINTKDLEDGKKLANKYMTEQLAPIATRVIPYDFDVPSFLKKFAGILKEK